MIDPSLVRGFWSPARPVELRPWTGKPEGPGVYFVPGVTGTPAAVARGFTVPADGCALIAYDPELTAGRLVAEEYAPATRPWHSRLPLPSSAVPVPVRLALLRLSVGPRLRSPGFPRWPAEPLLEEIRTAVRDAAAAPGARPEPLWPDGRGWAAALSHDFDSVDAFRSGRWKELAGIEESHGLRSSWHV